MDYLDFFNVFVIDVMIRRVAWEWLDVTWGARELIESSRRRDGPGVLTLVDHTRFSQNVINQLRWND